MPDEPDQSNPAPPDAGGDAPQGGGLGWKIAAGVAVVAAAISIGVLASLMFGGSSSGDVGDDVRACVPDRDLTDGAQAGDECPPADAKMLDGLVQKTDEGGFTIRVIKAGRLGETAKLYVRTPDRAYIDIAHAQTHAALGQPVRVYIEEIDGKDSVVYMEDAPLLE